METKTLPQNEDRGRSVAPFNAQTLRRLPIGAEILPSGAASFRVWAPKRRRVELVASTTGAGAEQELSLLMSPEQGGYFSVITREVGAGALYGFHLDDDERVWPDPASRFQPEGPAGLSELIDPLVYAWRDASWPGVSATNQVVYELHIGTFTPSGAWQAATNELAELATAGVTVIQVMPVADFPGQFGWGYDGVCQFAPSRLYGRPDDFRAFVDTAHRLGLGVILDVVYNHWGCIENHLAQFSEHYTSTRHQCEWGNAPNFDGEQSAPVREYFISNAHYWIDEFHLDGFRFDATQAILDHSDPHILTDVVRAAREAAGQRNIVLSAENETQNGQIVRPIAQGGHGCDWIINDDFHHSARVRLTDSNPAYYSDFLGSTRELAAGIRHGFIYQGQWSNWQQQPRGSLARDIEYHAFVHGLQNHDQIANSITGERIDKLTSPAKLRAMTALWLLSPQTPMFFQGQEFAASSPFLFFADHPPEQRQMVADGRAAFLSQFPAAATPEARAALPHPCDRAVFERCRLNLEERVSHRSIYEFHKDLLQLRRDDPVFQQRRRDTVDVAALTAEILVVHYFGGATGDRLVVVNLGRDCLLSPLAEPLLAPASGGHWQLLWSSNHPKYGGPGTPEVATTDGWRLPGESTVVLQSAPIGKPGGSHLEIAPTSQEPAS